MGRPSLYSPELVDKIVNTLASGTPKKFAAESNGISYDTLNDWANGKGGIPKKDVPQFLQRIMQAEALAVVARIARIAKAGQNGDWKADSWYLEHVHSETFSSRSQSDAKLTGKDGGAILVSFAQREDGPA